MALAVANVAIANAFRMKKEITDNNNAINVDFTMVNGTEERASRTRADGIRISFISSDGIRHSKSGDWRPD